MSAAVVVRTRDQWSRLRLVLTSLETQAGLDEVVVVDDGSIDGTPDQLARWSFPIPLTVRRHAQSQGQSAAWNTGAAAAHSDLLIFLDGDVLAGPGMVAAHRRAHAGTDHLIGRGETWHVRCTRFLSDPETGAFWPHEHDREAATSDAEREAMRVSIAQVRADFPSIHVRAAPGCYPGIGPRRLHEVEMAALADRSASERLWAAASGSNSSVRRDLFLAAGGFDPAIAITEHRELAYRLCANGAQMKAVTGARTYHLTHRTGWRDPLTAASWEAAFRNRHPEAPIDQLKHFWSRVGVDGSSAEFF